MTLELQAADTALLVVDYQERLCQAMPRKALDRHVANATHLLTLAARLEIPVLATEQYPQGLGPTIEPIRSLLPADPHPKTMFSALRDPATAHALRETGRRTIVLTGMETHICVFQTARDLIASGWTVQVPADAVVSRAKQNWRLGLDLLRQAGAVITNTEAVLFDLLKEGRGEVFKEISRRIR